MNVAAILENSEWHWNYDKLYVRPGIPARKLQAALASYAPGVGASDVLVLLDDTVFGGAKEGLILTADGMYAKAIFQDPVRVSFSAKTTIGTGPKCRLFVDGVEFWKADVVDHTAILTLAARLESVLRSGSVPLSGPSEGSSNSRAGLDPTTIFLRLHGRAMDELRATLAADGMDTLLEELIDEQGRLLSGELAQLKASARSASRAKDENTLDGEAIEMGLMLFLILHYFSLSRLPADFRNGLEENLMTMYGYSEIYKESFRSGLADAFAGAPHFSEEDVHLMSLMFFNADGEGNFQLTVPRREALQMLLAKLHLPESRSHALVGAFETAASAWLSRFIAKLQSEETSRQPEGIPAHEVLGVRPNASDSEIELAYRARRAQYHPDRYPQADVETLKWATTKMQELNEAFAELTARGKRTPA